MRKALKKSTEDGGGPTTDRSVAPRQGGLGVPSVGVDLGRVGCLTVKRCFCGTRKNSTQPRAWGNERESQVQKCLVELN